MDIKVISQAINQYNIIKFPAWADSHVNFLYLVRATYETCYCRLKLKPWFTECKHLLFDAN